MSSLTPEANGLILKATGLTRTYRVGSQDIHALKGVDLSISPGEFIAIVGPSGAGKSTMLHILGTLEQPTSGNIIINGRESSNLTQIERAELRRTEVGFVFQFHHLLPAFTALENVMMPKLILGKPETEAAEAAKELLESFGLGERLNNKPAELSGGEQQRVAVARALVNSPSLLLADEPTGNLDRVTGRRLEDDLVRFARERGAAVLVVTHNDEWAARADRVLTLVDGNLVSA